MKHFKGIPLMCHMNLTFYVRFDGLQYQKPWLSLERLCKCKDCCLWLSSNYHLFLLSPVLSTVLCESQIEICSEYHIFLDKFNSRVDKLLKDMCKRVKCGYWTNVRWVSCIPTFICRGYSRYLKDQALSLEQENKYKLLSGLH